MINFPFGIITFHDLPWPTMKFHDFPGLENEILKFHDSPGFPWPTWTLFYIKCKPWKDYEYITSYIDNSRWNIRYLPIKLWSALRLVIVFCPKLVESFYCNGYKQTGKWGEGKLITDFGNRTNLEVESEDKNQYQDTKVITMANHNRSMQSIKL